MKESMVNFGGGRKTEQVSQGGGPQLGFEG